MAYFGKITGLFKRFGFLRFQRSEKLFHTLFDNSPEPLILKDKNGNIIYASKSVTNLLGMDRDSLIGTNIDQLVHEEDKKILNQFYGELTKKPLGKKAVEIRLKNKAGSHIWVRNQAANMLSDKNVRAMVSSLLDITTRKKFDQARTTSLKKEKEARAVAEAAVKARDEFLSIASHELKTPLTTVLLQLQTTLRRILTQSLANFSGEDLVKSLNIAEHQSQRLSTLIKDLLNVSVVSTGKLQLVKETVDFSKLVKSMVTRFEPEIKLAKCTLKLNIEPAVIADLDTVRIEQAISNLLVNALKYGEGKPITISLKRGEGWAIFSIKDSGPGIHKKYQNLIFEPFKRANSTVAGLGVGLFIAKQIARSHNGDIGVLSTPGQGAEFVMRIPLPPAQA